MLGIGWLGLAAALSAFATQDRAEEGPVGPLVEIRSGIDGSIVRSAVIRFSDAAHLAPPEMPGVFPDPQEVMARLGTTLVADESGRVRLPAFDGIATLSIESGGLAALVRLERPWEPQFVVFLRPIRYVDVQVVDAEGAPQMDVPVRAVVPHPFGGYIL
jgi:hypothetical protein